MSKIDSITKEEFEIVIKLFWDSVESVCGNQDLELIKQKVQEKMDIVNLLANIKK